MKLMAVLAVVSLLGTASWAQGQGFEVVPWPARKPVPALSGNDLNGQHWRLADLKGRAVLLNFWASWCEPCRAEMPSLQSLSQFYGPEKLVVLALNFKDSKTVAERYVQRSGLTLPVLLDSDGLMARQWGATVFPTTVLIGADGRVKSVVRGELDWTSQAAAKLVAPLLKQEVFRSAQR